uniref:TF-B3 domain-containing protein n=1 Tax=Kalanchoe fedtschenkoi TaxID=63787 RepID=A0A7N0SZJ3_KALFE
MVTKAGVGLEEGGRRSDNLMHAAPPDAVEVDGDDVMVDFSCFGGYSSAEAAMEEADHQDLMENAAAIFCDDLIPPLPDFQCMSSSSSSSSSTVVKPVAYRSTASSSVSSSSSSWAVLRSDGEEQHNAGGECINNHQPQQVALSSTASMEMHPQSGQSNRLDEGDDIGCMDVMETLSYMDLLDENGQVWDYSDSPVFDCNREEAFQCNREAENQPQQPHAAAATASEFVHEKGDNSEGLDKSEDLAMVFFEWLKSNKESVSAEDLRSIKLKKSTVESAAKRLGNGKEGMKRLLQLILEWVQQHQLQRKRRREEEAAAAATMVGGQAGFPNQPYPVQYPTQPFQSPDADFSNSNLQPDPIGFTGAVNPPPWSVGSGAGFDHMVAVGVPAAGAGYVGGGDPFGHLSNMVDQPAATPWPAAAPPFCMNYSDNARSVQNLSPVALQQAYPFGAGAFNQYPYQYYPAVGNGSTFNGPASDDGLARTGSSATKEARKKRMARQRRFSSHHRHHYHHHNHNSSSNSHGHHHVNNGQSNQMNMAVGTSPRGRVNMEENYANIGQPPGGGNWACWGNAAAPPPAPLPLVPNVAKSFQVNEVCHSPLQQPQNYQRPNAPERRPGLKAEKNLRFLLQKVLKQSDVGSLGRIVLPKKEAETHLPQLTARDGINIAMEDIGTSNVWNMRYRFWPNNKSRMYLLENTGDFVKSNGLQEGDFIVIYSDIKCGKYMIRGVKVRQQGPRPDNRRSGKALKKNPASTSNGPSPSPNNTPHKETSPKPDMIKELEA